MKTLTTRAVILSTKTLGESDKSVCIYTEDLGKIRVTAKGACRIQSRFSGHLQVMNICKISLYFGPKNIILTEINSIKTTSALQNNLEKSLCALQIAEVTNNMLYTEQKLDNLLQLIMETLKALEKSEKNSLILIGYIIKILNLTGHLPQYSNEDHNLKEKFRKFFNFIKKSTYPEINKIRLEQKELNFILSIIQEILEEQTQKKFKIAHL